MLYSDTVVTDRHSVEPLHFSHALETSLTLIAELDDRRPRWPSLSLDQLFQELADASDDVAAESVEDRLWDVWTLHEDPEMADRMQHGIAAMGQQAWGDAEAVFNNLVRDEPHWAEAYNKRATLFHLVGRDTASVLDICRTLELEPRHFGALSGLGKICIRHDEPVIALFAFEAALKINPQMLNVRKTAQSLRRQVRATMN